MHTFGRVSTETIQQGLPPVVGFQGGSVWFGTGGHAMVERFRLPDTIADGLFVGFDAQPDNGAEQIVVGMSKSGHSCLRLHVNHGGEPGRLGIVLRDDDGRTLEVTAQGSMSTARRVIMTGYPRSNVIRVYELQPWIDHAGVAIPSEVNVAQNPRRFVFDGAFALGG